MLAKINKIQHQKSKNFFLIAGPCIIEKEDITIDIVQRITTITNKLKIPFIFKGTSLQQVQAYSKIIYYTD